MYAERLMLETDKAGSVKRMPRLPPNTRLEAIFLVVDGAVETRGARRHPHVDIAGKAKVLGDVMGSVPETDWNVL